MRGENIPLITPFKKLKEKQKLLRDKKSLKGEHPFIIPQKTKNKETKNKNKRLLDKL